MDVKKINFKDKKYVFPAILYPIVLFIGYFVIDMVQTDVSDNDPRLKTTDYLNSDLPEANTDSVLGGKLDNAEREYGQINDLSGVDNVEDDRDSVNKKEDYQSQYSEQEAERIRRQQQQAQMEEERRLRRMQQRVRQGGGSRRSSGDNFVAPVSDSEIERYETRRRQRQIEQMNEDLRGFRNGSSPSRRDGYNNGGDPYDGYGNEDGLPTAGSGTDSTTGNGHGNDGSRTSGSTVSGDEPDEGRPTEGEVEKVVKKTKTSSEYFNTITSSSAEDSRLIKAIIDENIKAQEGSRVRLRLLDDVEIGDLTVRKGTYLYAQVSGFGQQRVKGNVQSIFYHDDIIRVSLSIYDTDGQEGLYVPLSAFRETSKEILGSATQGGTNIVDNTTSSTGIKGWANQAVQNASQQVMNAVNKVVRRNRVKLKYGTIVYLIDGSGQEKKQRK